MNIRLTPGALSDLDAIRDYISIDDVLAGERIVARLLQSIAMLQSFPLIGRLGRVDGTRELSIARLPYFVVYRLVDETNIHILAVIHERRRFPE